MTEEPKDNKKKGSLAVTQYFLWEINKLGDDYFLVVCTLSHLPQLSGSGKTVHD